MFDQTGGILDKVEFIQFLVDVNDLMAFVRFFYVIHKLQQHDAFAHSSLPDQDFNDILFDERDDFIDVPIPFNVIDCHFYS